jgi:hypothetical protein
MIFGGNGIKFTRDFRPRKTVFADDAIRAQGTKSDKYFFMKFDFPVLPPKRGHGIEVRSTNAAVWRTGDVNSCPTPENLRQFRWR